MINATRLQIYSDNTAMPKPENIKPHEFKKGESGNPKGRPIGAKNRSTILKKWIEIAAKVNHPESNKEIEGTMEDKLILALLTKAFSGDVAAIKEAQDTLYGKIQDRTDITTGGDKINITGIKIVKDE